MPLHHPLRESPPDQEEGLVVLLGTELPRLGEEGGRNRIEIHLPRVGQCAGEAVKAEVPVTLVEDLEKPVGHKCHERWPGVVEWCGRERPVRHESEWDVVCRHAIDVTVGIDEEQRGMAGRERFEPPVAVSFDCRERHIGCGIELINEGGYSARVLS